MKTLFALLVIVLMTATLALSQPDPGTKTVPVFRMLGLGVSGQELYYMLDGVDVPVTFGEDFRSPFYRRPESEGLEFYQLETKPDGTKVRKPIVSAKIPKGLMFPLVLLVKNQSAITAQVLDDGPETLPGGSYRILNRLDYDIGLLAGKDPTVVRRVSELVIAGKPSGEGRTIFIQLFRLGTSERKLLFSNNWAFSDKVRTLMVVTAPLPPSELPIVRRIVEPLDALSNPQPAAVIDSNTP